MDYYDTRITPIARSKKSVQSVRSVSDNIRIVPPDSNIYQTTIITNSKICCHPVSCLQHTGSKKLRGATFVTIILLFGGVVLTLQARNTCVATKKASNKKL